ncbi:hypothetical protein MJM59_33600, partial [Salmonella enterica subsp. enterica serovar Montevideo]|nr:hypothetical protein [Salmonella enterica subsp. enterica serovar Montevideo]
LSVNEEVIKLTAFEYTIMETLIRNNSKVVSKDSLMLQLYPDAVLFDLLLKLANTVIDSDKVAEKIANEARDDTPQALDAVWE